MSVNEYGFESADGASPARISQMSHVSINRKPEISARAMDRAELVLAVPMLPHGHGLSDVVNEARGSLGSWQARVAEAYNSADIDALAAAKKISPAEHKRLSSEKWSLQFDIAVAQRALKLYSADIPVSRNVLRVSGALKAEVARMLNRAAGAAWRDVQDEKPGKETPASIQKALSDGAEQLELVQLAWPDFESAWRSIQADLEAKARSPKVIVANRETPEQLLRPLPPMIVPRVEFPTAGRLHATAPGSQVYIDGPDTLGILLGLMGDEISAKLKANLAAQYAAAKSAGQLILSVADRANQLKTIQAEIARLEKLESVLIWSHVAKTGMFPDWIRSDMKPDVFLGICR
jgi:hypothetical protein